MNNAIYELVLTLRTLSRREQLLLAERHGISDTDQPTQLWLLAMALAGQQARMINPELSRYAGYQWSGQLQRIWAGPDSKERRQLDPPRPLGRGSFGHVFRVKIANNAGKEQLVPGEIAAVKQINMPIFMSTDNAHIREQKQQLAKRIRNEASQEVEILKLLSNSHCGQYIAKFKATLDLTKWNPANPKLEIYMEFVDGRDLYGLIYPGPFPREELSRVFGQLAKGLACMHDLGVVHRDIKPENIMITDDYSAKYIDFGLACRPFAGEGDPTKCMPTDDGTTMYKSPEIAQIFMNLQDPSIDINQKYPPDVLDGIYKASDVWALGLILYELIFGRIPPRHEQNINELIKKSDRHADLERYAKWRFELYDVLRLPLIDIPDLPADVPEIYSKLLHGILQINFGKRCSIGEVVSLLDPDNFPPAPPESPVLHQLEFM